MPDQKKSKTLASIRANAGVHAAYRRALNTLLTEMQSQLAAELEQITAPSLLGTDESLASVLTRFMRRSTRYWQHRLDQLAPELAKGFAEQSQQHTDHALMQALKRAGFTVRFQMSPQSQSAFEAVVGENVGLIKSLGLQALSQVQAELWRSVTSGYQLSGLATLLRDRFGVAKSRAALIARDQSTKAKVVIEQARRLELGITEAIWQHSGAGKHPRHSHVKANGQRYEIAKGCLVDGEYIQPGQLINCQCTSRAVIPFLSE